MLSILLQAEPHLNETVEQLTKSSIELAEATANLGALKVMAGIFMAFALVLILIFIYQIVSTSHKIDRVDKTVGKVEEYFKDASDKTMGKAQAQIVVRRSFNSFSQNVKYTILRTRIENHIENREATLAKVNRLVNYEYAELKSFLGNFNCQERPLSEILDHEEDNQLIVDYIMEQIYLNQELFTISNMDQATDILINGLKLEYLKKL